MTHYHRPVLYCHLLRQMMGYDTILAFSRGRCKPYAQSPREHDIVQELIGSVKPRKRADLLVYRAEAVRRKRINRAEAVQRRRDPPLNAQFNLQTLQSSRHWKREKFSWTIPCRGSANALASLRISTRQISRPPMRYEREVFFFSFRLPRGNTGRAACPHAAATRNENTPDSPPVKRNEGTEEEV